MITAPRNQGRVNPRADSQSALVLRRRLDPIKPVRLAGYGVGCLNDTTGPGEAYIGGQQRIPRGQIAAPLHLIGTQGRAGEIHADILTSALEGQNAGGLQRLFDGLQ